MLSDWLDSITSALGGLWQGLSSALVAAVGTVGWVDATLGAVLLVSVLVGVIRGFLFEVLSVAGWFVAYFAAQWLAPSIAPHLPWARGDGAATGVALGAAFAIGFVLSLLVWALISRLVRVVVQATPLSGPDRLLGAGFGLVRGGVILLALATLVGLTPLSNSSAWRSSSASVWLGAAIQGLKPLLPPAWSRTGA
jgi:membrane protein required for colicin V production